MNTHPDTCWCKQCDLTRRAALAAEREQEALTDLRAKLQREHAEHAALVHRYTFPESDD